MARGFGIGALVCAIIAIFIPLYGLYVSALAIALAVVAALSGDRTFATATAIIAAVNTLFLSPLVRIGLDQNPQAYIVVFLFIVAPFVAIFLNKTGRVVLKQ